jgi:urease accessory protein
VLPAFFVAASALGVALHLYGFSLAGAELLVAASVLVIGASIARGITLAPTAWAGGLTVAGFLHGYAYGESIFGAEATSVVAYLVGLVMIQSAVAIGIALFCRRLASDGQSLAPRLAGAVVAGIGIAMLGGQIFPSG